MLDVNNIFAVLCVSLLALQPLINLKFFFTYCIYVVCCMYVWQADDTEALYFFIFIGAMCVCIFVKQ